MLYYANQLIYRSAKTEKEMKFSTEFIDYLKHTVANTIEYKDKGGDGFGEFIIEGTNFKKAKIVDSEIVYPKFKTSIKVSEKLKSNHKQRVSNNELLTLKSGLKSTFQRKVT